MIRKEWLKRCLTIAASTVMMCGVSIMPVADRMHIVKSIVAEASTNGHTADEAIAWCEANVGNSLYNGQCVGLIVEYYKYLGQAMVYGNAKDYATNSLPGGWQRIPGATPQKGDILVYTDGLYGHVAIYASDSLTYHQNYSNVQSVQRIPSSQWYWNRAGYWGVIRPDFTDPTPDGHEMTEKEAAGQTIPDGDYYIVSRLKPDYRIDIPGASYEVKDRTNISMVNGLNDPTDVFTIEYLNNGFYKIKQHNSKSVIEVYGASLKKGSNVSMFGDNDSIAQQWSIEKTTSGYKIRSRANNFYFDIYDGNVNGTNTQNGARVMTWDANGDESLFTFIPYKGPTVEDGTYTIETLCGSGFYVSGDDSKAYKDGTNIMVSDKKNTFRFEYVSDGYYRILETTSGLALTVDQKNENFMTNCINVCLRKQKNGLNQLWSIKPEKDGYVLVSRLNGYVLDLQGAVAQNNKNIFLHVFHGDDNQIWKFDLVNDVEVSHPISNIKVENVTISGYDVICDVDESWGIDKIEFPTWTLKDDQDDLIWHKGTISNGKATFHLDTAEHSKQTGTYRTHIYIWDSAGNVYSTAVDDVEVPSKAETTVTKTTITTTSQTTTSTTTSVTTTDVKDITNGDVNGDGMITLKDVVMLRRYIAGGWNVEINEAVADVNKDGNVNLKDVVMLRRYIAGGWGIVL